MEVSDFYMREPVPMRQEQTYELGQPLLIVNEIVRPMSAICMVILLMKAMKKI